MPEKTIHPKLISDLPGLGAIKLGGIYIPHTFIETALSTFCAQIFTQNQSDDYPYTIRGSAFPFRSFGKLFCACCRHQFNDYDPNQVSIKLSTKSDFFISPHLITHAQDNVGETTDFSDLLVMSFKSQNYDVVNLDANFLDTTTIPRWRPGEERGLIAFGYPTDHQMVDYEVPHIHSRLVSVGVKYDSPSNSPFVHRLKLERSAVFDVDGMSGGPVFFLRGTPGDYEVGVAGIVIRGGRESEYIHILDWGFVLDKLCPAATNE